MEPEVSIEQGFSDQNRIKMCKEKPEKLSLNEIYQEDEPSTCGYCHKEKTSYSWSFTKEKMEPYTYELLIERGWRRCGTYYYKPNLIKSCCKLFTHRLEVDRFKPKKDQKKAMKKVITLAYQRIEAMECEQKPKQNDLKQKLKAKPKDIKEKTPLTELNNLTIQMLEKICLHLLQYLKTNLPNLIKNVMLDQTSFNQFNFELGGKLKFFASKPGEKFNYYSNFVMLIFGLNKKLFANSKYTLIDFASDVKEGIQSNGVLFKHKIQVQRGGYLLFKDLQNTHQFEILEQKIVQEPKKQKEVMKNEEAIKIQQGNCLNKIFNKIKGKFRGQGQMDAIGQEKDIELHEKHSSNYEVLKFQHQYKGEINITYNKITFGKITIDIVPAEENEESFKLYQNYTRDIHQKKEKSMSSYVNFLCLQALEFRKEQYKNSKQPRDKYIPSWDPTSKHQPPKEVTGQPIKLLGCYHMKYYFEERLIAVGVIDMIEDGLSSVYYFYDPHYKEYRLGVFSSVIEIEYIRWMSLSFPQFKNYYMGFYISNCEKMSYKADYMPCQMLCPITYQFVEFTEQIKDKMQRIIKGEEKDIRLAAENVQLNDDMNFGKILGPFIDKNIKLMYNGKRLVLKDLNANFFKNILNILKANVPVYGKKVFDILTFTL